VAGFEAVARLVHPHDVRALAPVAAAGALGFAGNWVAAVVRGRAGRRLASAALIADGDHARADAYVSLAVVAGATRQQLLGGAVALAAGAVMFVMRASARAPQDASRV
jgi:divalent metal cation (Fe/Co/Zn/Cd) transporter